MRLVEGEKVFVLGSGVPGHNRGNGGIGSLVVGLPAGGDLVEGEATAVNGVEEDVLAELTRKVGGIVGAYYTLELAEHLVAVGVAHRGLPGVGEFPADLAESFGRSGESRVNCLVVEGGKPLYYIIVDSRGGVAPEEMAHDQFAEERVGEAVEGEVSVADEFGECGERAPEVGATHGAFDRLDFESKKFKGRYGVICR